MINLTVITLSAMLLAFFMVVYQMQKSSSRKRRIKQDFETLDLAKQVKCDTRISENLTALGLNPLYIKTEQPEVVEKDCNSATVFASVIVCSFLVWAVVLMNEKLYQSGALIFAFALACVWGLIRARRNIREVQPEHEALCAALEQYEKQLDRPGVVAGVSTAAPVAQLVSTPNILDELYSLAKGHACVPEDSTLKRHYLSQVAEEVEASLAPKPTDSALKRHYCAQLKTEVENRLSALSAVSARTATRAVAAQAVSAKVVSSALEEQHEHLPEDATLRRHCLTELKAKIVSKLPPCPSDFNLRRHYNAMVQMLLQKEVDEHFS